MIQRKASLKCRIDSIFRKYDINPIPNENIKSIIHEARKLAEKKKDNWKSNALIKVLLKGRIQNEKTGKWLEKEIAPTKIDDVIDWIATIHAYLPSDFGHEMADDPLFRWRSLLSLVLQQLQVLRRLRRLRNPKVLKKIRRLQSPKLLMKDGVTVAPSDFALSLYNELRLRVQNVRSLDSRQGDDRSSKAAKATEHIMSLLGKPVQKKSVLKAARRPSA